MVFSENLSVCHGSAKVHGWGLKSILQSSKSQWVLVPGVREAVGSGSGEFGSQDKRVQHWESAGELRAGTWAMSGSNSLH